MQNNNSKQKINLIADGITEEMVKVTEDKFKLWDEVIDKNLLSSDNEEEINYAYSLLEDTTIWAYSFLRIPGTEDPLKLRPYQDIVLNDDHDRVLSLNSNQQGKSFSLCVKALHFSLLNPGKTIVIYSKTVIQCKDLLRQIKLLLQFSILDYKADLGDTENKTEITFRHSNSKGEKLPQSRIVCVPSNESALGYKVDLGLWDEAGFHEDSEDFYYRILNPRCFASKGQIIIFSNPYGQQGILWELWNGDRFHKYRFNFFDNKENTQEEFDKFSNGMSQEQIDSTLLAIFTSQEGGFLTVKEREILQEHRDNVLPMILPEPVYVFYDLAKSKDRTVRVIGAPRDIGDGLTGIYIYEMKEYPSQTPYSDIVDELRELILDQDMGKISGVGFDSQGVGAGVEDFIKKLEGLGITITPVPFSLERKSAMYMSFKFLAETNVRGKLGISIPYVKECDKQLSMLRFNKTARGLWQVHHEHENDRDDFPDAIAGLCGMIVNPDNKPVTVTIIGGGNKFEESVKEIDLERCDCGNIIDDYPEKCSFCGKVLWE